MKTNRNQSRSLSWTQSLFTLSNLTFTFVLVALSLYTLSAHAFDLNATGITPPPDSDLSLQGINKIFGLDSADSQFNVLSNAMGIWNGSMMFIGSIIVGYIIIMGVLKTAHDGAALGQNWNSMIVPFRASVGLTMTAPVFGGYATIQLLVVWCAIQGVGVADMMWSSIVGQISKNGGYVVQPQLDEGSLEIFKNLYLATTCEVATNKFIASEVAGGSTNYGSSPYVTAKPFGSTGNNAATKTLSIIGIAEDYGISFKDDAGFFNCGGFHWTTAAQNDTNLEATTAGGLGNININALIPTNGMGDQIINTQRAAIVNLHTQMLALVTKEQNTENPQTITLSEAKGIADQYSATMGGMVQQVDSFVKNEGLKTFGDQAGKDGWAMAGAYYARISHFNAAANDLAHSAPNDISDEPVISNSTIEKAMAIARQNIVSITKEMTPGAKLQQDDLTIGHSNPISSALGRFAHPFLNMQSGMIGLIQKGGDPLTRMQNIGHVIVDMAWGAGAAAVFTPAGEVIAGGSAAADKAGGVISSLASIIGSILMALLIAGIFMAFVLPMIPYMLMLFSVMAWYTSLFIAFVAAPLWMISHATPDGHEAFGSGSNGYVLLMSIVLRPALTILSMIGSMAILYAMDGLLNAGYMTAFAGAQMNSISGPIGLAVGVVLYCIISTVLVYSAYHLVQTVPNAILQWIGGKDDDSIGVHDHNNRVIGAVWQSGNVGGGAIGGAMGNIAKKNAQKGAQGKETAIANSKSKASDHTPINKGGDGV